jgi:dolichol kinase
VSSPLRLELARKAIHLATGVVPIAYAAGVPRRWVLLVLGALCAAAVAGEVARVHHARVGALFARTVGALFREHERDRWSGATWLALAHLAAALLFPRAIAVAAMWGVSVGDAAGAIVGHALGRTRPGGGRSRKSLEGSAACLAATLAGALLVARLSPWESALAAVAATAAEWPSRPLDDNIRIVAAVGGTLMAARALAGWPAG